MSITPNSTTIQHQPSKRLLASEIDTDLYDKFSSHARETSRSRSALMRRIIERYLSDEKVREIIG